MDGSRRHLTLSSFLTAIRRRLIGRPRRRDGPRIFFTGEAKRAVIEAIRQARKSIHVAMFAFTDPDYADALIDRHAAGVKVVVKLDSDQLFHKVKSQGRRLEAAGVTVRYDKRWRRYHHKVLVVDGLIVATGSMNWTAFGGRDNAENITLYHSRRVARAIIREEFLRPER